MEGTAQPRSTSVDVSQLIDERGLTFFNVSLVIFCFCIVFFDGYDITAMGTAAPALIRAWRITNQASLGPVLGASVIGILFGSLIFGNLGERFGRRFAIITSVLFFGVFTLGITYCTTLNQMLIMRLLTGVGIGGLLPNVTAMVAEFAPRKYRATMIIVMFTGVGVGGSMPGVIAASILPRYGWQILFTIGGVVPIVVAVAALIWLPESIKFLALRPNRQADVLRVAKRLRPDLEFASDTQFVIRDERRQVSSLSPKNLFAGGMAAITLLVWVLFIANLMAYFFLVSWTPVLLASIHVPLAKAALANSAFHWGGAIGGWVLARPMDKYGLAPMKILFALSVVAVGLIGYVGSISETLMMVIVFISGFCVLSIQYALNAISGMIYPTSFRAAGSGWAFGVGRIGSIVGPIVGGLLIGAHLSVQKLYIWAAVPLLVATVACFVLSRLYVKKFQGAGMGQRETVERAAASSALSQ